MTPATLPTTVQQRLQSVATHYGIRPRWLLREAVSVFLDSMEEDSGFAETTRGLAELSNDVREPAPILPADIPQKRREALSRLRSGAVLVPPREETPFGDTERVLRQWAHDPTRGNLLTDFRRVLRAGNVDQIRKFILAYAIEPEEVLEEIEHGHCKPDAVRRVLDMARDLYPDGKWTLRLSPAELQEAERIVVAYEESRGSWIGTARRLGMTVERLGKLRKRYQL